MKTTFKLLSLSALLLSTTACDKPITDDPISALNGLVQEYGFIGYENPLDNSGTGVMLAGRPNALAYVAPASDCFSEDALVREYDTQYFNRTYNYTFQGNLGFTVFGSALFSAGLGLDRTHTVNIELNGITIEYLSAIQVTDWYQNGMSETCKLYLEDVGFVTQALITDSMKISIQKLGGTNVGLTEDNIVDFIDFNAGVDYQIIDAYTVEVSTPKYIGYQLGRIRMEDGGRVLYRAMVAVDDQFVFEPISLFGEPEAEEEQRLEYVSDMDKDNIYLQ
tara:strand:- start:1070 stop:1903 length:834 start_codon:yes stop_codon:yes gene_type:complete